MSTRITVLLSALMLSGLLYAQESSSYEDFKRRQQEAFSQFTSDKQAEYDAFRREANAHYADMMAEAWQTYEAFAPEPEPLHEEIVPLEAPEPSLTVPATPNSTVDPVLGTVTVYSLPPDPERIDCPKGVPFAVYVPSSDVIPVMKDVLVIPTPEPAPEPIAPVVEPATELTRKETLSFYGTPMTLKFPASEDFRLEGLRDRQLADSWKVLSTVHFDALVASALEVRSRFKLCDWAYVQYLQQAMQKHYGQTNDAVFVEAFLLTQAGYRVRLARGEKGTRLLLLVASDFTLSKHSYFDIDGRKFYYVDGLLSDPSAEVCKALFPKEKNVSMQIRSVPALNRKMTEPRTLQSRMGLVAHVGVNRNLIDFFDRYPRSCLEGDMHTTWLTYANTPLDRATTDALYPAVRSSIEGLCERDAVGKILNWCQTAFEYRHDDEVWGVPDRVFFAVETLHYPYSDCEDRAILFSRLVRDIVGDEVVLLYYPGHLATAVCFKSEVRGDGFMYKDKKFTVCDPTYKNAMVGMTMPSVKTMTPKVVVLE